MGGSLWCKIKGPEGAGRGFDKDMAPRAKCDRHDWPARESVKFESWQSNSDDFKKLHPCLSNTYGSSFILYLSLSGLSKSPLLIFQYPIVS